MRSNPPAVVPFSVRFLVYALVVGTPFFHPGIGVAYDASGIWTWFVLVPVQMLVSYVLAPPRLGLKIWLAVAALPLAVTAVFITGFDATTPAVITTGLLAFFLTWLLFHGGGRFAWIAFAEQLFPAYIFWRYLAYTRTSEELAAGGLPQTLLFLLAALFVVHGFFLYRSLFRPPRRDRQYRGHERIENAVLAVSGALFLLMAVLLPGDFVENAIVRNLLNREPDARPIPLDAEGRGWPNGNLLSRDDVSRGDTGLTRDGLQGRRPGDRGFDGSFGQVGSLEGVPADEWGDSGSGPGNRQRAVMVVATELNSVYAAGAYHGEFDAERGFLRSRGEPLNELANLRLLNTWRNRRPADNPGRVGQEIFFLSTSPVRYLAYAPEQVEPTILDQAYHPFNYSYDSVSMVSMIGGRELLELGDYSPLERGRLAPYLALPLDEFTREVFMEPLRDHFREDMNVGRRIMAILKSFETFQYELGFEEDTSVATLMRFVTETRTGDCTEFSNTAALMGRLLGIPSRVVTGYLASRDLQTMQHYRGLMMLRDAIPVLGTFPLEQLYLVTTAHRHSWVQFYLPTYGWVDFEATAEAIPPPPGMDPNEMTVVIPLIEAQRRMQPREIPWALVGRALVLLAAAALVLLYGLRYGYEMHLSLLAARNDPRGLRARYRLLLFRLANRGYPLKARSATPLEFSESVAQTMRPAQLYTRLYYGNGGKDAERQALIAAYDESLREAAERLGPRGRFGGLRQMISLRGLKYL